MLASDSVMTHAAGFDEADPLPENAPEHDSGSRFAWTELNGRISALIVVQCACHDSVNDETKSTLRFRPRRLLLKKKQKKTKKTNTNTKRNEKQRRGERGKRKKKGIKIQPSNCHNVNTTIEDKEVASR